MPPVPPRKIVSFQELDSFLGDDFVLLCGSAISGRMKFKGGSIVNFLPMAEIASEKFFLNLHDSFVNRYYLERVLSKYALELVSGKYSDKREKRKFEDFLWHLKKQLGEISVSQFLYSLYYCEPGQFLPNHRAITNLLTNGRVKLCLTTNFDNAIENSSPNLFKLVHSEGLVIDSFPSIPTLLKLHGDVIDGSYIATVPQLYNAEQAQSFLYLEQLLKNKVVLVVGCSGNGDIDIAPHLRKAKEKGAKFVWLVKPNGLPSDISTDWFVSDLFSSNSDSNWLLKLGGIDTQNKSTINNIAPDWEARLGEWCKSVFSNITVQQNIDLLDELTGWAKFHLYYLNKWNLKKAKMSFDKDKDLLDFATKCLGIGTCYSSLSTIREIDRVNIQILGLYDELLVIKGFSNWRLIKLMEASNTLRYFSYLEVDDQVKESEIENFRVYIEVLREILNSYTQKVDARNFYYDHQVGDACKKLLLLIKKSNNPTNIMLSNLVVFDIEEILGYKNNIDEYRDLYERAVDLKLYGVARAAARSILRIDFIEGISKLVHINKIADETWAWHSIKHNSLAVFEWIPKLLINPAYIANIVMSRVPALAREFALVFKKVFWRITYKLNIVINE